MATVFVPNFPVSVNREARKTLDGLLWGRGPLEELQKLTVLRAYGRDISLDEFSLVACPRNNVLNDMRH